MVSQPMENKDFCVATSEKTMTPGGSRIVKKNVKLISDEFQTEAGYY